MRTLLGLALAVSLFVASSSRADLALPKDLQNVDPVVKFEGIDQYTDHVFYLRFLTFSGGPSGVPHKLLPVKDGNPFAMGAQRRLLDLHLLALDRKEHDKKAKEDPSLKWLTDKTEGVLKAVVQTPSTVGPVAQRQVPVTAYKVTLKDGKLTTEMVSPRKTGDAGPSGLLPLWVIGILGATGLTWAGFWFSRRRAAAK